MDCHGKGTRKPQPDLDACPSCHERPYCELHRCRMCLGRGVVCPVCRGMRFVCRPTSNGNEAVRCIHCCEGNNINPQKEIHLIERYLKKYGIAILDGGRV